MLLFQAWPTGMIFGPLVKKEQKRAQDSTCGVSVQQRVGSSSG